MLLDNNDSTETINHRHQQEEEIGRSGDNELHGINLGDLPAGERLRVCDRRRVCGGGEISG